MKKSSSYKLILGYLGIFMIFVGITILLPLILLFFYPDESKYWVDFFVPGLFSIVLGICLSLLLKKGDTPRLGKHQDSVLLIFIWLSSILLCSIPFLLKGDMSFTDSIFETTSAFSTIGLSVFTDYDAHLYIFYRALLTLIGGVGLVLVITSAISDRYGLKLYVAEGHNDRLMPNLRKSATVILSIYVGIIVLGTVAYCLAGVPVFDSMIHSISAVATGGFSSKAGGIIELEQLYGNGAAIEIISIVLMISGATNFLIHMFFITGKFSKAIRDCEVKVFAILAVVFIPLFFLSIFANFGWKEPGLSFRYGAFTFISSITTTGFCNVPNNEIVKMGQSAMLLVILMNIIGGGMGSTSGGIKQYRLAVAIKSFYWVVKARLNPSRYIYPHYVYRLGEDHEVTQNESIETFGYIILYILLMITGGFLVSLIGNYNFGDALFEFSNAISSTGLSNGIAATANPGVLWVLIIGMFAGRLEILPIIFAFYRMGRDVLRKETI